MLGSRKIHEFLERRPWVAHVALMGLSVVTTLALMSSQTVLAAIAASSLVVLVFALTTRLGAGLDPKDSHGLCTVDRLNAALDDGLTRQDPLKKTACLAVAIDGYEQLLRDWGDTAADEISAQIVDRMSALLRSHDMIASPSAGQFAIAVSDVRVPELGAVIGLCERLQKGAVAAFSQDGTTLHLSLSIGFCIEARTPEKSGAAMASAAQLALAEAQRAGPGNIRAFSATTQALPTGEISLADDVLQALENGEIRPWFQPQISTDTGQITGFEALARWNHPVHGVIPPAEFLPVLEAADRMEALSETMLNASLKALKEWDKLGVRVPTVAVNFATTELRNPSLVERIKWDVDRFEIEPARLTIEILETVLSGGPDDIITRNIRALRAQGFRIDLDDFGTGHASLSNVRRFGVDRVKIDRSFVMQADDDPEQQRMVAAIVGMSEQLGIETLAEGVETIGEQGILAQLGCTHLQGFAIAHPMPFEQTSEWIAKHNAKLTHTPRLNRRHG